MTTTATRSTWTARQARYDGASLIVTTTRGDEGGSPVHFWLNRHGAAARTWVSTGYAEVVLWRRGNKRPTYQGSVIGTRDGWRVETPDGTVLGTFATSYADAEAQLLRLRTRRQSMSSYSWPTEIRWSSKPGCEPDTPAAASTITACTPSPGSGTTAGYRLAAGSVTQRYQRQQSVRLIRCSVDHVVRVVRVEHRSPLTDLGLHVLRIMLGDDLHAVGARHDHEHLRCLLAHQ